MVPAPNHARLYKICEYTTNGIRVNGKHINNIKYTNDIVLLANNLERLHKLVNKVTFASKLLGLEVSIKKTKYMAVIKSSDQQSVLSWKNLPIETLFLTLVVIPTNCETTSEK